MAPHRFFACGPVPAAGTLPLSASDAHHIRDVLRLRPGARIVLVDPGGQMIVRLSGVGETITGVRESEVPVSARPRVILAQGIAKGERMDTVIRQATEIGVDRIVPFTSERCVVKLEPARAQARV